jgi:2-polyprenyl-3-methyl-5-hydroxy-6-metoxy-1,4-benzoquinol methylase
MFAGAKPTGEKLNFSDVQLLTPPCDPSKMICLWNNFHQLAAKNDFNQPKEPLWFLKAPNSYHPANRPIERPATYAGKIIYEGELGVVIGKKCFNISEAEAGDYICGYTCVNDVTAGGLLAAKFALAGDDVTVIDQGAHLAAIQKNGLKLEWHDGKVQTARTEAGKQDIVVLAVKAHFLDQVVRDIDALLGPETVVLTVQNGLPWGISRDSAASTTITNWKASIPRAC